MSAAKSFIGCVLFSCLVASCIMLSAAEKKERAQEAQTPTCKSDWTKCKDIEEMADKNSDFRSARWDCERKTTAMAKYGEPKWPKYPFEGYRVYKTDQAAGRIVFAEDDAQFQNGFGAMAHVRIDCEYDLKSKKVTNVDIRQ